MAVIQSVATELPSHTYSRADILRVGTQWLESSPDRKNLFERFVSSSQIEQRHFAIPLEKILSLNGAHSRAQYFHQHGGELLKQVVTSLFNQSSCDARMIDHFIFTSCSAPVIPSIDVGVIESLNFSPSVNRVPIYQHGCAGGIVGLALASRLAQKDQTVLLTSVELCSLIYQSNDFSGGNLVGSALFADGAAAVVISDSGKGLRFTASCSYLIPNSAHLMGYDIADDGTHLRLDRELPQALSATAPTFITNFLNKQGMTPDKVSWWLFHPGGVKVLKALEEAFSIEAHRSRWAWEVLEQYGNMSSASILFVLDRFIKSGVAASGDTVCMVGVGPGLTIETILLTQE